MRGNVPFLTQQERLSLIFGETIYFGVGVWELERAPFRSKTEPDLASWTLTSIEIFGLFWSLLVRRVIWTPTSKKSIGIGEWVEMLLPRVL